MADTEEPETEAEKAHWAAREAEWEAAYKAAEKKERDDELKRVRR